MNVTESNAWSIKETASFLGLSIHTLYAYVTRRKIPHLKIGSRLLFDPQEMMAWRAARRVPPLVEELAGRRGKAVEQIGVGKADRKESIGAAG